MIDLMATWVPIAVLSTALLTGLVTGLAARPVLRALREPVGAEEAHKLPYVALATRGFAVGCGLVAAAGALLASLTLPPTGVPTWLALSSVGVLLAGIDLRSTWLPRRLSQLAWLLAGLALAVSVALGAGWAFAARSLAGAAIAAALYALVWALSRGGIGFGDVRFAPLVGLAAGGLGWSGLLIALTAGSLLGAGYGLSRLARGRGAGFPYAPVMLAGGYVALLLDQLMPST